MTILDDIILWVYTVADIDSVSSSTVVLVEGMWLYLLYLKK